MPSNAPKVKGCVHPRDRNNGAMPSRVSTTGLIDALAEYTGKIKVAEEAVRVVLRGLNQRLSDELPQVIITPLNLHTHTHTHTQTHTHTHAHAHTHAHTFCIFKALETGIDWKCNVGLQKKIPVTSL